MWYEILPSIGVIFTCMSFATLAQGWVPQLILGKPTLRKLESNAEGMEYLRDKRLTGSPYKMQGLEAIPDPETTKNAYK